MIGFCPYCSGIVVEAERSKMPLACLGCKRPLGHGDPVYRIFDPDDGLQPHDRIKMIDWERAVMEVDQWKKVWTLDEVLDEILPRLLPE